MRIVVGCGVINISYLVLYWVDEGPVQFIDVASWGNVIMSEADFSSAT
jgi:hypothetical protein